MTIKTFNAPYKGFSIFKILSAELLSLKKAKKKAEEEITKSEQKIESFCSDQISRLLSLIPEDEKLIFEILNSKVTTEGNRTLLQSAIEGTFEKEKFVFNKDYTVKMFIETVPFVENFNQLLEALDKLNIFWANQAKIEMQKESPFCFFNFYWL